MNLVIRQDMGVGVNNSFLPSFLMTRLVSVTEIFAQFYYNANLIDAAIFNDLAFVLSMFCMQHYKSIN